jgi:hypothetical protein
MSKAQKNSAYKSMRLASEGKTKPTTKANNGALKRWTDEKWVNLSGYLTDGKDNLPCGKKGKKQKELNIPTVCRPSVKVNEKTPKLAKEFTKKQIEEAIKIKIRNERINWLKL